MTRVCAVTGASAGIGRAIAVALGELGWVVALGARRVDRLEETAELVAAAGGRPLVHVERVHESLDGFCRFVEREGGAVDVLVNNAGTAIPGAIHEMDDADHRHIIETNLTGPVLLTRRVVATMRAAARPGDVVFISSDTTRYPRPALGTYMATKGGLEAFARVLALECEGTGIRSSVVRVGPTLTGFSDGWDLAIFDELLPRWQRFGIQRHWKTLTPEDVGRAVVNVVTAPPHAWVPIVELQPTPPVDEG